ncbi:MAG: fasciclin domain-containing protein [Flavobacteriales bacterium]|nr:fasciclin domain-containing protein [Flavobacteriales bacterium]
MSPTTRPIASALFCATLVLAACGGGASEERVPTSTSPGDLTDGGQSTVVDDQSQKNVVGIAVGSPDHTTLVAAVQAAELVDVLTNAGPFTVFAPTNAAFDALPAGTVEGLLKPEKKADLQTVLQYHVFVGVLKPEQLTDGRSLGMVDGGNVNVRVKDGKVMINEATIIASVPASNGIVHVIDRVLLPG